MIKVCISDTLVHKLGIQRGFYSKHRILKPDLSTNLTLLCSKTIELGSLLVKLMLDKKIVERSGFTEFIKKLHLDERMVTAKNEK